MVVVLPYKIAVKIKYMILEQCLKYCKDTQQQDGDHYNTFIIKSHALFLKKKKKKYSSTQALPNIYNPLT